MSYSFRSWVSVSVGERLNNGRAVGVGLGDVGKKWVPSVERAVGSVAALSVGQKGVLGTELSGCRWERLIYSDGWGKCPSELEFLATAARGSPRVADCLRL